MANLKALKEKLKSTKSTSQITKAMKLVSTVKLKRSEELAKQSKAYENALTRLLNDVMATFKFYGVENSLGKGFVPTDHEHTVDIILVTSDKGMCGSFNIKSIKAVSDLIRTYEAKKIKVRLKVAGKKGASYFQYRGYSVLYSMPSASIDYKKAETFIQESVEDYKNDITSRIVLVHNAFKNKLTQEVEVKTMLPLDADMLQNNSKPSSLLHIEADNPEEVIEDLISKYVQFSMYYALIDSLAAEHSARMQAMETATKNANEVTQNLTIQYNKARQASVTSELIEIISGVESMK